MTSLYLFTRNKQRIQKFKETEYERYIYRDALNEICFQHNITYKESTDYPRRIVFIRYCVIKH